MKMPQWIALPIATLLTAFAFFAHADNQSNIEVIEGFASPCTTFLANGNPQLTISVTKSPQTEASGDQSQKQKTVWIDGNAGYQIANLYARSKVKEICARLWTDKGQSKVRLEIVTSGHLPLLAAIEIAGTRIVSDAFYLQSQTEQELLSAVVSAYVRETNHSYYLIEALNSPYICVATATESQKVVNAFGLPAYNNTLEFAVASNVTFSLLYDPVEHTSYLRLMPNNDILNNNLRNATYKTFNRADLDRGQTLDLEAAGYKVTCRKN